MTLNGIISIDKPVDICYQRVVKEHFFHIDVILFRIYPMDGRFYILQLLHTSLHWITSVALATHLFTV